MNNNFHIICRQCVAWESPTERQSLEVYNIFKNNFLQLDKLLYAGRII